ncbi:Cell division cycle protein [Gossypium arboreum]|uniref:Cell division cycle protein n=1 Tax=Gossypium arboreum TaxID=29729 RepID=A0A0B0MUP1_GOSAR|nr:Cell division cycle protein [Gossypium arboreum]
MPCPKHGLTLALVSIPRPCPTWSYTGSQSTLMPCPTWSYIGSHNQRRCHVQHGLTLALISNADAMSNMVLDWLS